MKSTVKSTVIFQSVPACCGFETPTREYEGDEPLQFVLSLNLHRRHLNEGQRAAVATNIANITNGGDRKSDQSTNSQTDSITQSEAAKMLNVGVTSVALSSKVRAESPELFPAIQTGVLSPSLAVKVIALPEEVKQAVVDAIVAEPETAKEVAREAVRAHVIPAAPFARAAPDSAP